MEVQSAAALVAIVISIATFARQELLQQSTWRKSNTFALFEMWNGEILRAARSHLWLYYEANPTCSIKDIRRDRDLNQAYNAISHFFVDSEILLSNGYLDRRALIPIIKQPAHGWLRFFELVCEGYDGDETLRSGTVIQAVKAFLD